MANTTYPLAKEAILSGSVDLPSNTINIQAYDGAIYNAAHDFLSDLAGTKKGTAVTVTSKAVTNGRFTASVPTYSTLSVGDQVTVWILYVDGANDAARRLLAFLDRKGDGSEVMFTSTGAAVNLTFPGPLLSIGGT